MNVGEQIQQTVQNHGGYVGTGATGVGAFATFMAKATPVLQFFLLAGSCLVMVLTVIWYIKRLRAKPDQSDE